MWKPCPKCNLFNIQKINKYTVICKYCNITYSLNKSEVDKHAVFCTEMVLEKAIKYNWTYPRLFEEVTKFIYEDFNWNEFVARSITKYHSILSFTKLSYSDDKNFRKRSRNMIKYLYKEKHKLEKDPLEEARHLKRRLVGRQVLKNLFEA